MRRHDHSSQESLDVKYREEDDLKNSWKTRFFYYYYRIVQYMYDKIVAEAEHAETFAKWSETFSLQFKRKENQASTDFEGTTERTGAKIMK